MSDDPKAAVSGFAGDEVVDVKDDASALLDHVLSRLPHSAERTGQRAMVNAIWEARGKGSHLIVQAGTGTGKSLGYLIPALHWPGRVIVSTATKALQAQLSEKDAPLVAAAIKRSSGRDVTVGLAKGRRNYLCLERMAAGVQDELDVGAARPDITQLAQLRQWVELTEAGDRDDLNFAVNDATWRSVSVDGRDCLGASCTFREECFTEKARLAAAEADLVITNHALLTLDACTEANVLPPRDLVIVDEAHELDRFVTEALTAELSATALARTVRLANKGVSEKTGQQLSQALVDMDGLLRDLPTGLVKELPGTARVLLGALERTCTQAARELSPEGVEDVASEDRRALAALREVGDTASALLAADDSCALHVSRTTDGQPGRLRVSPLEVSRQLAEGLLRPTPVIMTSATLAVDGGFDHVARQLGFHDLGPDDRKWSSMDVGSPFDYQQQALLYIAADLPEPGKREAWQQAVDDRVVELIQAAGGRCLALFSSKAAATRAAARVRATLPLPVLLQGEDTDARLVWRFASDPATSLFATRGFWNGVDVPGTACQLVIIDRLPFTYVDNPLHKARVDRAGGGYAGFSAVAVPEAAMALAQGVGRLIRDDDDRGVVALLDPRLHSASYARRLLVSLPPMRRTVDKEAALGRLREIAAAAVPPRPAGPEPGWRSRKAAKPQREAEAEAEAALAPAGEPDEAASHVWTENDDRLLRAGVKMRRALDVLAERHAVPLSEVVARIRYLDLTHVEVSGGLSDEPVLRATVTPTTAAGDREPAYTVEQKRLVHARAYEPWSSEEDEQLMSEHHQGLSVRQIAAAHNRNGGAIRSRIKKLGLLEVQSARRT